MCVPLLIGSDVFIILLQLTYKVSKKYNRMYDDFVTHVFSRKQLYKMWHIFFYKASFRATSHGFIT